MELKALIFDLDGVICFTDEYHYLAWKAMADSIGVLFDQEVNNRLRGVSRMASLEIVLEHSKETYSQTEKESLANQKNEIYKQLLTRITQQDLSDEVKTTLLVRLDAIACRTLRSCMQSVFEDGPKRDRRLWMGDLRMQALANYETYQNNDLVKRCLYLFAGTTMEQEKIGACLFLEPEIEVDDTDMFDYALFYIPTLLSYLEATGDVETAKELYPTAVHQLTIARQQMDENGIVMDSDRLGWCFVDWNLFLNKQASAMGIYLYCLDAAERLARKLNTGDSFADELKNLRRRAFESFWDAEKEVFVSGADKQVSWASQVWMVLGGVVTGAEAAQLLDRIETIPDAMTMVTPYMYHNYVGALLTVGQKEKALSVLRSYWGGMAQEGADTFWELYDPKDPNASPYGGTIVNSYCHAWSCAPAYFLRKFF